MLDTYHFGTTERMSPEAPVPVVDLHSEENHPGGAANVAINIQALDASASLISIIGNDTVGSTLLNIMTGHGLDTANIVVSKNRKTTHKSRVFSKNQQIVRFDSEDKHDLLPEEQKEVIGRFEFAIGNKKPSCVILQDYNKGMLTTGVIEHIIAKCNQENIPVAVDPKQENFFAYKGVALFKPNLREVKDALNNNDIEASEDELKNVTKVISSKLQNEVTIITLAEKGIFISDQNTSHIVPPKFRNVLDVSGAGDTVISAAALCLSTGTDLLSMAKIANCAGGLACENMGAKPVTIENIKKDLIA